MSIGCTPTAKLAARFGVVRGRTRLLECRHNAPLKIAKTFELPDGGLEVCVMDASPGLLDGDIYQFDWHLEANAKVRLTTQGYARVHPSRGRGQVQRLHMTLAAGAHLEAVPQPLLLFAGAALRLKQTIELAESSTFLGGEIIGAGRIERGEAFAFESFESRVHVSRASTPIFVARAATRPQHPHSNQSDPRRLGAWQNFTHRASAWAFGPDAYSGLCEAWREILNIGMQQFGDKTASAQEAAFPTWGGVSILESGGVAASLLGNSAWDLEECVRQLHRCTLKSM